MLGRLVLLLPGGGLGSEDGVQAFLLAAASFSKRKFYIETMRSLRAIPFEILRGRHGKNKNM